MKVALVHDYLIEFGGAERVLEALHEIFPEAPIFTAYFNLNLLGPHKDRVKNWDLKSSWLQNFPLARKLISPFRIFAPAIFESFDLTEFDLVISSCNTYYSKAVITRQDALHLSYIHTPPRYLYGFTTSFNYKKHWWTRVVGELMNHILRVYDFEVSQRPDILIANSKNVQERINKFYRRDSVVIYPPVSLLHPQKLATQDLKKNYYLSLSRLIRGKGVEIIVAACTKLNLPLKVVGSGKELDNLKKIAGKSIEFLGHVDDQKRVELLTSAKALIVASEDEDFGITAVESMASGTPVIAVKAGGYLETVIENKTGIFFEKASAESLMEALEKFDQSKFKAEDLKKHSEKFSKERFKKEILDLVNKHYAGASRSRDY
ncbi:glycosyltransferase [Candidatus Daviesbacteria bacterium]|nr:glycosyltransferase [Candidatus Daviesbacteria bacterium]